MNNLISKIILLIIILLALVDIKIAKGEEIGIEKTGTVYSDQKICNAIWYIEGQEKANQFYGINPKYVKCYSKEKCFNVCVKTITKWRKIYHLREYTHYKDFLIFLSYKYCPPNHVIWLKNLKFWLRKLK
jgi:hypothetical protein